MHKRQRIDLLELRLDEFDRLCTPWKVARGLLKQFYTILLDALIRDNLHIGAEKRLICRQLRWIETAYNDFHWPLNRPELFKAWISCYLAVVFNCPQPVLHAVFCNFILPKYPNHGHGINIP